MKTVAIIQAREGATRLPGKVMMDLAGKPALQRVIDRVSKAKLVDTIVVATEPKSEKIISYCSKNRINYFIGSEDDVMLRVLKAAEKYKAETIVEITADCPVVDFHLIDDCIRLYNNNTQLDYVSNCVPVRSFPDGCDVQVYSYSILKIVRNILKYAKKEIKHVGWNIPNTYGDIGYACIPAPTHLNFPDLRITLDTIEDFKVIESIYKYFWHDNFNTFDIIDYLDRNPEIKALNSNIKPKAIEEG